MNADTFSILARQVGATVPLQGTIFPKDGGAYSGSGSMVREDGHFKLSLTFPIDGAPPEPRGGTYTQDDMWRFEGIAAGHISITAEHVDPWGAVSSYNGIPSHDFEAQTIKLRNPEFNEALFVNSFGEAPLPSSEAKCESTSTPEWHVHATVIDYPLLHANKTTKITEVNAFTGESSKSSLDTFVGETAEYRFGLIQNGKDLEVHLRLTNTASGSTEQCEQLLTALLTGLAFATGKHCWPFRTIIDVDGNKQSDTLAIRPSTPRTTAGCFSERISHSARSNTIEWNFEDFLAKSAAFFIKRSVISEAAATALWLSRAASAGGIPGEIRLSTLCVLLESLTGVIFDSLGLQPNSSQSSFTEAKATTIEWLDDQAKANPEGFHRLRNIVKAAHLTRPFDKYKTVSDHFSLQWEGLMKDAWDTWQSVRHKMVHSALARIFHR